MTAITEERSPTQRHDWRPMELQYVGQVGSIMRGRTGTRWDTGHNCSSNKPGNPGIGNNC